MPTHIRDLPNAIKAVILNEVPLPSISQCRLVCKEWNSLIMSPEFSPLISAQCRNQNSPKPMLVENDHVKGCSVRVYSSASNSWLSISLPFLVDQSQKRPLYLTASSGGLMCFETHDRQSYIICNPITKKWRFLEPPVVADDENSVRRECSCLNPTFCMHWQQHNIPDTLTGLIVDRRSSSYKLIIASLAENGERRTSIYNSLKGSWTIGAQVPEGKGFVNPVALSVKGSLYCLIRGSTDEMVARYDAKRDIWYCSAPMVSKVPALREGQERELVEQDGGVKILSRSISRDGYGAFYSGGYLNIPDSPVLSVVETCDGAQVQGHQWSFTAFFSDKIITRRFQKYSIYSSVKRRFVTWQALASAYSASCTGHGNTMYTLCRVDFDNESEEPTGFRVTKINCNVCMPNKMLTLLPAVSRADIQSDTQIEVRLFEPSLTAQV